MREGKGGGRTPLSQVRVYFVVQHFNCFSSTGYIQVIGKCGGWTWTTSPYCLFTILLSPRSGDFKITAYKLDDSLRSLYILSYNHAIILVPTCSMQCTIHITTCLHNFSTRCPSKVCWPSQHFTCLQDVQAFPDFIWCRAVT